MPTTHRTKVAFIGTGIMGAPIAGHILDAGYDLTVNNRTKSKAEGLLAKGAHWADTPAQAAANADVIFTMLGYPADVEDVYLSTDGLVRAAKKGAYLVDLTTSSAQLAKDIHDACEVEDKHAFDCPVTGGDTGAKAGTLTLIVGAKESYAAPVLPILQTFSDKIYYMGGAGKGQTAKLCNQVSLAACMVGYADAMALAEQGGLDVAQTLDMVSHGMGGSVAMDRLAPSRSMATTSPASSWSTCARTWGLRSRRPRTQTSPFPAPRRPTPSMTCCTRLVARVLAPRQ